MKVLILRNPAAIAGCRLKEGETGDIPDDIARPLIKSGLAQCLDPPKEIEAIPDPPVQAVPPEPTVVDKPPPSTLATGGKKNKAAADAGRKTTKPKKQGAE